MAFYRGKFEKEQEEELKSIMELAKQSDVAKEINVCGHLRALTSTAFLKPFQCVGVIYLLYALSGIHIIHTYTLTFLEVGVMSYLFPPTRPPILYLDYGLF